MQLLVACFFVFCFVNSSCASDRNRNSEKDDLNGGEGTRTGKLFGLFQIVRFPNDPCMGTKNGTCYTAAECTSKGGVNGGSCAGGYGICCIFTLNAGGSSSQNYTYLQSSNPMAGTYLYTICPCNSNVCQLRLDFTTFVIAGPSTSTNTETVILNGSPFNGLIANGVPNSFGSRCLTDTFSVTNSGGLNPPVICGTNSGEHMYVNVDREGSNGCNELVFQLGTAGVFASIPTRMWTVKVTQYSCDSLAKAPPDCTQYFTGLTGTVRTYNFNGGQHLAFQRQTICVRICWTTAISTDFEVSGQKNGVAGSAVTSSNRCCGVAGTAKTGKNIKGYDCVQIPGALNKAKAKVSSAMLVASRVCGRDSGLGTKTGGATVGAPIKGNQPICSTVTPFYIRFISDGFETNMELSTAFKANKGFQLSYTQDSANGCM